jgi:hypothetical protein
LERLLHPGEVRVIDGLTRSMTVSQALDIQAQGGDVIDRAVNQ